MKSFKLERAVYGGHREACSIPKGQCYNAATNNDVIKSIMVTRKLPDGVYIRGSVQGYPLNLPQILVHQRQSFPIESLSH